jgi:chemotaxis response regulator CheB
VPVLVAQHLFPGVSRLDERLARASGLPVGWASDGQAVEPGRVYLCRQWREAAAHGRQIETRFRLWHAARREWHLTQVRARPLRDDDGSVRGWVAVNADLNALSQSEP